MWCANVAAVTWLLFAYKCPGWWLYRFRDLRGLLRKSGAFVRFTQNGKDMFAE
jgi:hypothetical protein